MLTEPAPATTEATGHFTYQPALDGLRALAVSAVVLYHLDVPWMRGGFMGVDAFFVLSGFLITSLLLVERRTHGTTLLRAFWARRARRLLPAVLVMIAIVTLYATTVLPKFQFPGLRGDAIASIFYVANWHFISNGVSYFDLFTAPSPFQHLWSLAIEEQFYVVWPLVFALIAVRARRRLRTLFAVCVAGIVVSQIVMTALYDAANPSRAYFATPARMSSILVGCALAVLVIARPHLARDRSAKVLGVVAFGALLLCTLAWIEATPSRRYFLGGDALFALTFATLLFALQGARSPAHRLLEGRSLVWIGGISYAVYLWHWPVILYVDEAKTGIDGVPLDLLRIGITIALALASTRLVEAPVRRVRGHTLLWAVPATAAALTVVVVTTTGATPAPRYLNRRGNAFPCTTASQRDIETARRELVRRGVPKVPALRHRNIAVIGDSRACSLLTGFDGAAPLIQARIGNGAVLGCGVVAGAYDIGGLVSREWAHKCVTAAPRQFAHVRTAADVVVVWSGLEDANFLVHGRVVPADSAEHERILRDRLEHWLTTEVPPGRPVALVLMPEPTGAQDGVDPVLAQGTARINRIYISFAAAHPDRVTVIHLDQFLCARRVPCSPIVAGMRARPDGTHLSPAGAGMVAGWMLPQLAQLVRGASTSAGP